MTLKQKLKADIDHLIGDEKKGNMVKAFFLFFAKKNFRIVLCYRVLNHFYLNGDRFILFILGTLKVYYRLMTNRYCVDISYKTKIGIGFKLNHAYGIVVNTKCILGDNVYIGHNVTLGSNTPEKFPKIGNNVTIYTGSIIVGNVTIGNNVVVGAGSLVIKDIPAYTTVVGHPCNILKKRD